MMTEMATIHSPKSQPASHQPSTMPTTISAPSGWNHLELGELWHYRPLIWTFLRRYIKGAHRQTLMGPVWVVLNPIINMIVFSFVLGKMANLPSDGVPYHLFTYAALLPWVLFSGAVTQTTGSLVTYMSLISKTYFPRLVIPLAATLSRLLDFSISFVILLALASWYGYPLTPRLLLLPYIVLLALGIGMSVGMLLAPLQVHYRDVTTFLSYIIKVWLLATPVAYAAEVIDSRLPASLQWLYYCNPMKIIVEAFRWAILGTSTAPGWTLVFLGLAVALCVLLSAVYFCRTTHSIVDVM